MVTVGVRELSRNTSKVVDGVENTGKPVVVTRHGRPVAVVYALDANALEDYVLSVAPDFISSMREADDDLREGHTTSAAEFFAELDAQ